MTLDMSIAHTIMSKRSSYGENAANKLSVPLEIHTGKEHFQMQCLLALVSELIDNTEGRQLAGF